MADTDDPKDSASFEQRFVLEKGKDGSQDVYDTMPRRKVGSIKYNGPGKQHSAYDADGKHIGDFDGGDGAKDAVKALAKNTKVTKSLMSPLLRFSPPLL